MPHTFRFLSSILVQHALKEKLGITQKTQAQERRKLQFDLAVELAS